MDAELVELEKKTGMGGALWFGLREYNRDVAAFVAALAGDRRQLAEKLDGARARLESLLKQIPE